MNISSVNAASSQLLAADSPTLKSTPSKPQSAPAKTADTVQLSHIAQAVLAASKEVTETPAQTAKEAIHGDLQAKRLLAKETAKLNNQV
jgi:hypothetical protein